MKHLLTALLPISLLALMMLPSTAHSQETAPAVLTPPISFCIGRTSHCVMPDLNLNTVNYDLTTKKWDAGVTTVGVGYALIFYSDQPWGSGIAVHGAGQWNQKSSPSYFALIPTVVLARYFEIGFGLKFMDGSIGKSLTLGLGAGLDLLTGKTMATRFEEAKITPSTPSAPPPASPTTPPTSPPTN